jgi:zinc transport system ATP-binding protein
MTAETSPLVELRGVGYRYGGDVALAGVDLELRAGERLAVLGPNGGGKSTLVKLLLGLLAPTNGRIRWHVPRRSLRLGYVPQAPAFDRTFPLRVEEMVLQGRLGRHPALGRYDAEDRRALERALAALEIAALRRAYLSELSGGELRRALIARALVRDPDLLVLDEPTASLDEPSRHRLWRLVAALPEEATVLLVTHDLGPRTFTATRAVLVDRELSELPLDGLHEHPLLCSHDHG